MTRQVKAPQALRKRSSPAEATGDTGEEPSLIPRSERQRQAPLERDRRLSESLIWRLQREFFERQGVSAWRPGSLPFFISSNPFIAAKYASVVQGFLRDCLLQSNRPLDIVELGAGHGRFSYLFLRELQEIHQPASRFRYIMTDVSANMIRHWKNHPRLIPFVKAGILDFARFDLGSATQLKLEVSGQVIGRGRKRPIAVIANYAFDSAPQDSFAVRNGKLFESRVTTFSNRGSGAAAKDPPVSSLYFSHRLAPVTGNYYESGLWNRILAGYAARLASGAFLFPTAALHAIESLERASDGRLLLLSADKGFAGEQGFLNETSFADLELHGDGGCLSLQVNYNAILQWIAAKGGVAWFHESLGHTFAMCAGLLPASRGRTSEAERAFQRITGGFTPEDFCHMIQILDRDAHYATLPEMLAVLRFSGFDSIILLRLLPSILELANSAMESVQAEIARAADQVWDRYYQVDQQEDLAFELGILSLEISRFSRAAEFFMHSLHNSGAGAATLYNLGMARNGMGDLAGALRFMQDCLALDADVEPARLMRLKLEGALRSAAPAGQITKSLQKRIRRGASGTG